MKIVILPWKNKEKVVDQVSISISLLFLISTRIDTIFQPFSLLFFLSFFKESVGFEPTPSLYEANLFPSPPVF